MFDLQNFFDERREWMTENENDVRRRWDVFVYVNRYFFDFKLLELGWEQFDTNQDFEHFGIWINKAEKKILTLAEGDLYLLEYKTVEGYNQTIQEMIDFHPNGAAFTVLDLEQKTTTKYFEDRTRFLITADE